MPGTVLGGPSQTQGCSWLKKMRHAQFRKGISNSHLTPTKSTTYVWGGKIRLGKKKCDSCHLPFQSMIVWPRASMRHGTGVIPFDCLGSCEPPLVGVSQDRMRLQCPKLSSLACLFVLDTVGPLTSQGLQLMLIPSLEENLTVLGSLERENL